MKTYFRFHPSTYLLSGKDDSSVINGSGHERAGYDHEAILTTSMAGILSQPPGYVPGYVQENVYHEADQPWSVALNTYRWSGTTSLERSHSFQANDQLCWSFAGPRPPSS